MSNNGLQERLRPYIEAVEQELSVLIDSACTCEEAAGLYNMLRYHLGWVEPDGSPVPAEDRVRFGGKRMRPAICLLFSQLAGGDWHPALPAAAAVELIHSFSLIHDDVEDADEFRHHRYTVWSVWGVNHAVNSGSNTQALVNLAALRCKEFGHAPEKVLDALHTITNAILRMTEGQYLDMRLEGSRIPTPETYQTMVRGKTCALLSAACSLGWLLGSPEPRTSDVELAAAFGEALGLAFQARDDFLGLWGDPNVTGKPVGSDLTKRKKTLPIVLAYHHANGDQRRQMERFFARRSIGRSDAESFMILLESLGAKNRALQEAEKLTEDAQKALEALRPSEPSPPKAEAYNIIKDMVTFVLHRNY
jgi:geranylgeranyl diphosphate synthase type I